MGLRTRLLFEGWGRRAAWAMLAVFIALQIAVPSLFATQRLALFDAYARVLPRYVHENSVIVVAVDDQSLKTVGQWPWPRQIIAGLVKKILAGHPAALGLDMLLVEPDRQSPEQWLSSAGEMPEALRDAIRQLPSHDALLGNAIAGKPVILGVGGLWQVEGKEDTGPLAPFRLIDAGGAVGAPTSLPSFNATVRSPPLLDNAAAGHGLLSSDRDSDGVIRRVSMVSYVSGRLAPSLSLEMLRLVAQAPWIDLYLKRGGVRGVAVGNLAVPTQSDGSIWVNYSPHDPLRFVSAASVLSNHVAGSEFERSIVLIGVTGLGNVDQQLTPVGYMPGSEIQAQLLENILDGRLARRPEWSAAAEPALTLLFGLFLIVTLPLVRPRWQIVVGLAPLLLLAAIGFGAWRQSLLLVDVATPSIGEVFVFVTFLGGSFAEADAQRRRLRRELEFRKLTAAKVEGELEAGRRIQMGMLPAAAGVAGDDRFDLSALIVPARQIGGDLYDFFKIDADHLYIAVGDVSGKGVPAALFMALGKALCKSCALRGEIDTGAVIRRANAEISRDNPEMLFITMFAGILNLETGELHFCNAGHEAPYLLRNGQPPANIASDGGPPLCVLDDFPYASETLQLQPGDLLCLTTDGVEEAMTGAGELLGGTRAKEILAAISPQAGAKAVAEHLHAGVERFVAGAAASDDLTILTVRWAGA